MPVIPLEYVEARLRPTAREWQYGLDHDLVAPGDAALFGRRLPTDAGPRSSAAGELAEGRIAERWYVLALLFLWESDFEKPLPLLEDVYCTFDHPEELAQFIPFMPAKDPGAVHRRSREQNIRALEDAWREWAAERQVTWRALLKHSEG